MGRKPLLPCRVCGVGSASSTLLCPPCGSHRIAQKLINTQKRAHRDFGLVLTSIKCSIREM